jgi:hypothetical protein
VSGTARSSKPQPKRAIAPVRRPSLVFRALSDAAETWSACIGGLLGAVGWEWPPSSRLARDLSELVALLSMKVARRRDRAGGRRSPFARFGSYPPHRGAIGGGGSRPFSTSQTAAGRFGSWARSLLGVLARFDGLYARLELAHRPQIPPSWTGWVGWLGRRVGTGARSSGSSPSSTSPTGLRAVSAHLLFPPSARVLCSARRG